MPKLNNTLTQISPKDELREKPTDIKIKQYNESSFSPEKKSKTDKLEKVNKIDKLDKLDKLDSNEFKEFRLRTGSPDVHSKSSKHSVIDLDLAKSSNNSVKKNLSMY